MEAKTNILGLLDWLFGSEAEAGVEEDPDPEEQRPYPIETEHEEVEYEDVASGSFERTIELIEFVGSGPMLVEYDEEARKGSEILFLGFTGSTDAGVGRWKSTYVAARHDRELIRINESNVIHRRELGSYAVELSQDVKVAQDFQTVIDPESVPDECTDYRGVPESIQNDDNNYVVDSNGHPIGGRYGNSFERVSFPWWDRQKIVHHRKARIEETLSDVEVEHTGSTAEIVADAVETGTNVVQAVLADGRTVVTDDVQGLDDESGDLMRIADLSSEGN